MKKTSQIALSVLLCVTVAFTSGCSIGKKNTTEKADSEYVTLGEYKKISLKKSEVTEQVQKQIDSTLDSYAEYKKKKSGKVKDGDTVNIYYVGKVNGKKFSGGSCTRKDNPDGYNLTIGSGTFIPGFEDGIIGMKKGETKDLHLKFPDDYSETDYAGKDVIFHVTVNKISRPKTEDAEQSESAARSELEQSYATYSETELLGNAWAKVRSNSTAKYIRRKDIDTFRTAIEETLNKQLEADGTTFDDYLSNQGLTQDEYSSNLESYAKELAKEELMIESLEKAEGISTDDQEYTDTLQTMADQNNMTVDELREQVPDLVLKQYGETKRLSERIVSYADVTEKTADADEALQNMS